MQLLVGEDQVERMNEMNEEITVLRDKVCFMISLIFILYIFFSCNCVT